MRRTIITILSTALVLAASAAIVNAAGGGPEREVAASSAAAERKGITDRAQAKASVRCRNLGCINRKLTKLTRDAFQCERVLPVTRYQGYFYTPDGGVSTIQTTALDETEPGDAPTYGVVIYTC
jgi:hypothetical protein